LIEAPGKNKQDTAEELDVNRNTVNKIEASWDDLPVGEKIELMQFLQQKFVEDHFSTPEQLSGRPETA
jgi:DNA-binding XRE family transcriptional regulator